MIKLKKIEIEAFRSFKEFQSLEFPDKGLYLIKGLNKDTGGSSNSGKSSFNLAIAYGLGFCPYPSTVLQSYLSNNKLQVTEYLEINGKQLEVSRGKQNYIVYDNIKLSGATSVNSKLQELFKIDTNTLQAICYRAQSTRSKFLEMGDTEKKDFLSNLLQLNEIENSIINNKDKIDSLEKKEIELNSEIRIVEAKLELYNIVDNSENLKINIQNYNDRIIENKQYLCELDNQIEDIDITINKNQNKDKISKYNKDYNIKISEYDEQIQIILKELNIIKEQINSSNKNLDYNQKVENKILEINNKISYLDKSQCPTCEQIWINDSFKKELSIKKDFLLKTIKDINKDYLDDLFKKQTDCIQQIQNIENNQKQLIQDHNQNINQQYIEFKDINSKLYEEKNQKQLLINKYNNTIQQFKNSINNHELQLNNIILANRNKNIIHSMLQKLQLEYSNCKEQIAESKDFIDLIGKEGFLGSIFDEILQEISEETNEILKYIPNTARISIRFVSEKSTQKGTIDKLITPIVMKSGIEIPLKSGLSGGMLTAVELAVDFAISAVISRRSGINIGWLILDESFDGLGVVEKEACTDILKKQAQNKLILVVDHSTEFKENFDGFINIELENEISRIVNLTTN